MRKVEEAFAAVGARVPRLLLPEDGTDYHRYAVVACDQFSAQPEYWDAVEQEVGNAPSTFRMILPEARLPQTPEKAAEIHKTMGTYLADGTLREQGEGLIYLHRQTTGGIRRGLMIALDLEEYDYSKNSHSLIRATEGTVVERLPARIEIREGAPLEIPHIMVLLDDPKDTLMGLLEGQRAHLPVAYDFPLMQGGGHLAGWKVQEETLLFQIAEVLGALKAGRKGNLLYAIGDGNHSLAAAKACWERMKPQLSPEERETHPARFALVELVNLYDKGLTFEPIHRLLLHVDPEQVQREVGFDATNPPSLQELQPRLDQWLLGHPEAELEYIHGTDECRTLGKAPDRLAIIFGEFRRETLYPDVIQNGALVRKSFSMGTARDKRYYLEGRRILP